MMRNLFTAGAAAAALLAAAPAFAQSASSTGTGATTEDGATGGTAGSAAAGSTSASTIGMGAVSGDASAVGGAGSAAAPDGRARTHVTNTGKNVNAMAMANDQGTHSKSMTHTKVHKGQVRSRTKTMAHVPGSKPAMSTSTYETPASATTSATTGK